MTAVECFIREMRCFCPPHIPVVIILKLLVPAIRILSQRILSSRLAVIEANL